MLVQKQAVHLPYKSIRSYDTIHIWCSDGWMYDRTTRIRRKFTISGNALNITSELYKNTSYSDVQYTESVKVFILSETPLIWVEKGDTYEDLFEEMH